MTLARLRRLLARREVLGFATRLASVATAVALNIVLARTLPPAAFGQLWFVLSTLLLLAGLLRVGAANFLVREVAAAYERAELRLLHGLITRALQTVLICSLVLITCTLLIVNLIKPSLPDGSYRLLLIGLPMVPLLGLMGVLEGITRGFGNMVRGQIAEFIIRPSVILGYVVLLALELIPINYTLPNIMLGFCAAAAAAALIAYMLRDKEKLVAISVEDAQYRSWTWAKSVFTLSLTAWLGLLNIHLNPILLGVISTDTQVALFQVSSQLAFLTSFMVVVMNSVQGADFSKYHVQNDREKLQSLATHSCRISLFFSTCVAICYLLFGHHIIALMFGASYVDAYPVLSIIMLGTFINAISGSAGTLMNSCNQEKEVFSALLWALVLSVIVSVVLIPMFGAVGAACSVTVSLAIWNIILIYKTRKILKVWALPFYVVKS